MTFLLMTSIFGTAVDDRGRAVKIGGFGIGLTVAFDILAGGAVTGASMNPARSFGPAFELMYWEWHWAYWVAPIVGACVAALIYEHVLLRPMRIPRAIQSRAKSLVPTTAQRTFCCMCLPHSILFDACSTHPTPTDDDPRRIGDSPSGHPIII